MDWPCRNDDDAVDDVDDVDDRVKNEISLIIFTEWISLTQKKKFFFSLSISFS